MASHFGRVKDGVCVDFGLSGANPAMMMSAKGAGNIFDRLKDAVSNPNSFLMTTPAGRAIFKGAILTPTSLPALSLALASAQPEAQTMEMLQAGLRAVELSNANAEASAPELLETLPIPKSEVSRPEGALMDDKTRQEYLEHLRRIYEQNNIHDRFMQEGPSSSAEEKAKHMPWKALKALMIINAMGAELEDQTDTRKSVHERLPTKQVEELHALMKSQDRRVRATAAAALRRIHEVYCSCDNPDHFLTSAMFVEPVQEPKAGEAADLYAREKRDAQRLQELKVLMQSDDANVRESAKQAYERIQEIHGAFAAT
eukprot:gnl/MRDRNA2_/MRDRNA2_167638_c0_seq1.p1 gnl/MRDRNA2_/MRDRNA2_167638_c0~~gnl/MRDRNA2_/MRDRNA2_167638_c0_seq1.p1  ORF type:complete len:359 (+),score=94.20 gnl/MRDRNA2_/MRDRNA2_167638_c0_seq1:138-1079(+)